MKATIIKFNKKAIVTLENGQVFTQQSGESAKNMKARIEDHVDIELGESVTFKNEKLGNLMTEALESSLENAKKAEGGSLLVAAIVEELSTRDDYEGSSEEVDTEENEEVTEVTTEEVVEEPVELTPLQEAAKTLKEKNAIVAEMKSQIKSKVEEATQDAIQEVNKAKATLELANIDTETVISDADNAYKAARRVVAVNNLNVEEKSDEQKALDIAAVKEAKDALDTVRKDAKEAVKGAKDALESAKAELKKQTEEAEKDCLEGFEDAKIEAEEAKKVYDELYESKKVEAEKIINEVREELAKAEAELEKLAPAYNDAKALVTELKNKERAARGILKTSGTTRTNNTKMSFEEATEIREAGKAHIGKTVEFTPSRGNEVLTGVIKGTSIDKRVNTAYFRIVESLTGKSYHVVMTRLDVESAQVETKEA